MTCLLAFALAAASFSGTPLLLSTEELAAATDALAVDTRGGDAYLAGHLPGALHLDPGSLAEERGGVPGLLKPFESLRAQLAAAGIDPERHVVVYCGMADASDFKQATRLYWILDYLSYPRVSVLNGGFAKWRAEQRPVQTEAVTPVALDPASLNIVPRPERFATREEVIAMMSSRNGRLIDLRPAEEYAGLSKKDFVAQSGHIAGACNLPAPDFLQPGPDGAPYFVVKTDAALSELLADIGGDAKTPAITYCNTGRDASIGYFGLKLGGHKNTALYDGSMAEWSHAPAVPVEDTQGRK